MSLLDDVSIVVTPNGYKAGELYAVVPVPVEGAEEVTNGDFANGETDWTFSAQCEVVNNQARILSTDGSFQYISQNNVFDTGKNYKLEFDVISSNGATLGLGGGIPDVQTTTLGRKTIYTSSSVSYLQIKRSSGVTDVVIDNISVKEYTSADMDVTRATAATRVDENGLVNYAEVVSDTELVTNGDFATDSNWTKGTGWTISGGTANANTSGNYINLYQNSVFTVGKAYKYEFTVSNYSQGDVRFTQSGVDISGLKSANGIYTGVFSASQTALYIQGVNSFIGSIDNVSVKEVIRDNVPRIDYTGGGCPHILAEPQRTNLLTYSEDFSQWSKLNGGTGVLPVLTSDDVISPDGTQNADKIVFNKGASSSNSDYSLIRLDYGGADIDGVSSIYLKSDIAVDIEISSDDINYTTINITTEWQRFTVSDATSDRLSMGLRGALPSNNTATIYAWGAQLEEGSYATSYIPTSGSTVTRNQDIFTRDGIGSLIGSEGVLFVEMAALSNDGTNRGISLNDGTSSNRLLLYFSAASNQIAVISTGFAGSIIYTLPDETSFNKIAVRYKANDITLWVDGESRGTPITSATIPTFTALKFDSGSLSSPFFGKVKQLQVYDTALTDTQLAALTS